MSSTKKKKKVNMEERLAGVRLKMEKRKLEMEKRKNPSLSVVRKNPSPEQQEPVFHLPAIDPRADLRIEEEIVDRSEAFEVMKKQQQLNDEKKTECAQLTAEADSLAKQLYDTVVSFSKREKTLSFEDKAETWQQILDLKQSEKTVRRTANSKQQLLQQLTIHDPYAQFTTLPSLNPSTKPQQHIMFKVWLLGRIDEANPLYYYGAYGDTDAPPQTGWLSCSASGVNPCPIVTVVKTAVDTVCVSKAGSPNANGKYVVYGQQDGVYKFMSANESTGLQLFRKSLAKNEFFDFMEDCSSHSSEQSLFEVQLPSEIRQFLQKDHDFHSLTKLGSWLAISNLKLKSRAEKNGEANGEELIENSRITYQNVTDSSKSTHTSEKSSTCSLLLCRDWVYFRCIKDKASCQKRHFYISMNEKQFWSSKLMNRDAQIEKNVLKRIYERESILKLISEQSSFLTSGKEWKKKHVLKLVEYLNWIRLATVRVIEEIEIWRKNVEIIGYVEENDDDQVNTKFGWSTSITVTHPNYLYKPTPAYVSKIKRWCRDADLDGEKEQTIQYLGCFETKVAAEKAYDEYASSEARRRNTSINEMPKRRSVLRSCGLHYAIESVGTGPSFCIECKGKPVGPVSQKLWIPPFKWQRKNYILKISDDLNFLSNVGPLVKFLGKEFPLLGNSFLLPKEPVNDEDVFGLLDVPVAVSGNEFGIADTDVVTHHSTRVLQIQSSGDLVREKSSFNTLENHDIEYEILTVSRIQKAIRVVLVEEKLYGLHTESEMEVLKKVTPVADEFEEISVLYWDRCAALSIKQLRLISAKKKENVWCRPDDGVWQSLVQRGSNMKSFEFRKDRKNYGEQVAKERKRTIHLLRKELKYLKSIITYKKDSKVERDRPYAEHLQYLEDIIENACKLKGDVVFLEVRNLQRTILDWQRVHFSVCHIQTVFRRMVGLNKFLKRKWLFALVKKTRLYMEEIIAKVASSYYYKHIHHIALTKAKKNILFNGGKSLSFKTRIPFSVVRCLDNQDVILSVRPSTHDQYFEVSEKKKKILCGSCAKLNTMLRYSLISHKMEVISPPCYCQTINSPPEDIILTSYDWLSSTHFQIRIENQLLITLLKRVIYQERIPSDSLLAQACNYKELQTDELLNYNPKQVGGKKRTFWEPIKEAQDILAKSNSASYYYRYWYDKMEIKKKRVNNLIKLATNFQHNRSEAIRAYQYAEAQMNSKGEKARIMTTKASRALAFSKNHQFNLSTDSSTDLIKKEQSWDPLENANEWCVLIEKRKANKAYEQAVDAFEKARFRKFQSEMEASAFTANAMQEQNLFQAEMKQLKNYYRNCLHLAALASITEKMLKKVFNCINGAVTLRYGGAKAGGKINRTLIIKEHHWSLNIHQHIPSIIKGFNLLSTHVKKVEQISKTKNMQDNSFPTSWKSNYYIVTVKVKSFSQTCVPVFLIQGYKPEDGHSNSIICEPYLLKCLLPRVNYFVSENSGGYSILNARSSFNTNVLRIANALIQLVKLDFYTGKFTLGQIHFYQTRRILERKLWSPTCHWWKDFRNGRMAGKGIEIMNEAVHVDGIFCHVVVFENWGDLMFEVFDQQNCNSFVLKATFHEIANVLYSDLLHFNYWLLSVKTNKYSYKLIQKICTCLNFNKNPENNSMKLTLQKKYQPDVIFRAAQKLSNSRMLVTIREDINLDLYIEAFDLMNVYTYKTLVKLPTIRKLMLHKQELLRPCNRTKLCSMLCNMLKLESAHLSLNDTNLPGKKLEESVKSFNAWISRCKRSPMSYIPESQTQYWACHLNATAYQSFYQRQLVVSNWVYEETRHKDAKLSLTVSKYVQFSKTQHFQIDAFQYHNTVYLGARNETIEETEKRFEEKARCDLACEDATSSEVEAIHHAEDIVSACDSWIQSVYKIVKVVVMEPWQIKLAKQLVEEMEFVIDDEDGNDDENVAIDFPLWVEQLDLEEIIMPWMEFKKKQFNQNRENLLYEASNNYSCGHFKIFIFQKLENEWYVETYSPESEVFSTIQITVHKIFNPRINNDFNLVKNAEHLKNIFTWLWFIFANARGDNEYLEMLHCDIESRFEDEILNDECIINFICKYYLSIEELVQRLINNLSLDSFQHRVTAAMYIPPGQNIQVCQHALALICKMIGNIQSKALSYLRCLNSKFSSAETQLQDPITNEFQKTQIVRHIAKLFNILIRYKKESYYFADNHCCVKIVEEPANEELKMCGQFDKRYILFRPTSNMEFRLEELFIPKFMSDYEVANEINRIIGVNSSLKIPSYEGFLWASEVVEASYKMKPYLWNSWACFFTSRLIHGNVVYCTGSNIGFELVDTLLAQQYTNKIDVDEKERKMLRRKKLKQWKLDLHERIRLTRDIKQFYRKQSLDRNPSLHLNTLKKDYFEWEEYSARNTQFCLEVYYAKEMDFQTLAKGSFAKKEISAKDWMELILNNIRLCPSPCGMDIRFNECIFLYEKFIQISTRYVKLSAKKVKKRLVFNAFDPVVCRRFCLQLDEYDIRCVMTDGSMLLNVAFPVDGYQWVFLAKVVEKNLVFVAKNGSIFLDYLHQSVSKEQIETSQ